ncbi:hypothetical protein QT970_31360 [Microcoleus sp. herbarium8]
MCNDPLNCYEGFDKISQKPLLCCRVRPQAPYKKINAIARNASILMDAD